MVWRSVPLNISQYMSKCCFIAVQMNRGPRTKKNKMKPTNPNAHTYVNGTDVKTHGYEVTHNTFLQSFI